MYEINLSPIAQEDLKSLRKFEQKEVLKGIKAQLRHEPTKEARNRKRLDRNELAEWELRLGRFRVLYNVETGASRVQIEAIGVKEGNLLFIRGRRITL